MKKIKVLCVDDSPLIRKVMSQIVNSQPDMEMIATAPDPLVARDMIKQFNPDVLTLDVEMPNMTGLEFLERLMRLRPMPVIMISTLTTKGSETTLNALELGAVDFVAKPELRHADSLANYSLEVADKIRGAAQAQMRRQEKNAPAQQVIAPTTRASNDALFAIGSSTGGTEALRRLLVPMPESCPGIVIAQHMPPGFTRSFADRMNALCKINVKEAEDGDQIQPGHAYIAPGDFHMTIVRSGDHYKIALNQSDPVNRHRPSVDVLFDSVARVAGKHAVGALLTGMGSDGAAGLLKMHTAGAWTIAQSEKTCVVFGMPREAIELGAASEVVDLDSITQSMLTGLKARPR
ncbi:chemotaxis response regulator protein-glutamate methylesterase [Enterobacterales bacterium CwR94]|nr:chemotaxis response regulator protein-glutamate methylesterase [Enterobacterales bacterium CwR94]